MHLGLCSRQSKNLDKSKVSPLLFGVEPTDLTGPLVQFQAAKFEKPEIKRVVRMINTELGDDRLASDVLDSVFEMWWPKLDEKVSGVLQANGNQNSTSVRTQRDLLEEVLTLTRAQARRANMANVNPKALRDLVEGYAQLVQDARDLNVCSELSAGLERLLPPLRHLALRSRRDASTQDSDLYPRLLRVSTELKTALAGQNVLIDSSDEDDDLPF
jgi:hypothetical protein